jgi:hypothetical protein
MVAELREALTGLGGGFCLCVNFLMVGEAEADAEGSEPM